MSAFHKALLRTALGRTYDSMVSTFERYPGLRGAHMVDIIMRADGKETRIQADWLKEIVRLVIPFDPTPFKEGPPNIDATLAAIDARQEKQMKEQGVTVPISPPTEKRWVAFGPPSILKHEEEDRRLLDDLPPKKKNEITEELGWGAIPHVDAEEGTLISYIDMGLQVRSVRVDLSRCFRPFFLTPNVNDAQLEQLKDALRKEPGDTLYHQKGLNGFFLCTYDRGE